METVITSIVDEFPMLREGRRKILFTGLLCIAFFLIGLPQCAAVSVLQYFYLLLYPRTKSGTLRIQHGHAAAEDISVGHDNSKNILLSLFKFGMWVHMGGHLQPIVLWPWPLTNRPMKATLRL